jgi:hypothetical protein
MLIFVRQCRPYIWHTSVSYKSESWSQNDIYIECLGPKETIRGPANTVAPYESILREAQSQPSNFTASVPESKLEEFHRLLLLSRMVLSHTKACKTIDVSE